MLSDLAQGVSKGNLSQKNAKTSRKRFRSLQTKTTKKSSTVGVKLHLQPYKIATASDYLGWLVEVHLSANSDDFKESLTRVTGDRR